jgi:hypothetical protein
VGRDRRLTPSAHTGSLASTIPGSICPVGVVDSIDLGGAQRKRPTVGAVSNGISKQRQRVVNNLLQGFAIPWREKSDRKASHRVLEPGGAGIEFITSHQRRSRDI